ARSVPPWTSGHSFQAMLTKRLQRSLKIRRKSGLGFDYPSISGMLESQPVGMQRLATNKYFVRLRVWGKVAEPQAIAAPVRLVRQNRTANAGQMHADLMGPACSGL